MIKYNDTKIEFSSMIGEITAISLEHTLKFIDSSNIEGDFIVSGTYKLTEASRIEEKFNYNLPAEIILSENIELSSAKIEIDDFYYEIENDYSLICYIDVKVEGVEIVELEEEDEPFEEPKIHYDQVAKNNVDNEKMEIQKETIELEEQIVKVENIELPTKENLTRECDGEINEENIEMEKEEIMQIKETQNVSSLFENINESEETYSTYSVYILREEETISSLIEKYKTTKEELESYNDITNLSVGSKIIIPLHEQ